MPGLGGSGSGGGASRLPSPLMASVWGISPRIEPWDIYQSQTIANGVTSIIARFQVPNSCHQAYLQLFGHGIDDSTAWASSTWIIRVNGVGAKYYDQIQDQLGEFSEPTEIGPIVLAPNSIVDVQVTNNSAASHLFAARHRGRIDWSGRPVL